METFLGIVLLVLIALAVRGALERARPASRDQPPSEGRGTTGRPPPARPETPEERRERLSDEAFVDGFIIGGWYHATHHGDEVHELGPDADDVDGFDDGSDDWGDDAFDDDWGDW